MFLVIPDPNPTPATDWPLRPANSIILAKVSRVLRNPSPIYMGQSCTLAGKEAQISRTQKYIKS